MRLKTQAVRPGPHDGGALRHRHKPDSQGFAWRPGDERPAFPASPKR